MSPRRAGDCLQRDGNTHTRCAARFLELLKPFWKPRMGTYSVRYLSTCETLRAQVSLPANIRGRISGGAANVYRASVSVYSP